MDTDGLKGKRTVERLAPPFIIILREKMKVTCEMIHGFVIIKTVFLTEMWHQKPKDDGTKMIGNAVVSKGLTKSRKLKELHLRC